MRRTALALALLCAMQGAVGQDPAAPPARDAELARLREQVVQMRAVLQQMEAALARLEAQAAPVPAAPAVQAPVAAPLVISAGAAVPAPAPQAAPVAVPPPPAAATPLPDAQGLTARERAVVQEQVRSADARAAWASIHNGMKQDEVRRLLGAPQREIPVGNRVGWYYTYGKDSAGSVFFDHGGAVISIMAPAQGTFHLY